jgi:hypothetical protein
MTMQERRRRQSGDSHDFTTFGRPILYSLSKDREIPSNPWAGQRGKVVAVTTFLLARAFYLVIVSLDVIFAQTLTTA